MAKPPSPFAATLLPHLEEMMASDTLPSAPAARRDSDVALGATMP
jgi:hypothetical protein